eukprot:g1794.t1
MPSTASLGLPLTLAALVVLAAVLCPSEQSFVAYLDARRSVSLSGQLGNLVLQPLRALGLSGENHQYWTGGVASLAKTAGGTWFVGLLGIWFPVLLPSLPASPLGSGSLRGMFSFPPENDVWVMVAVMVVLIVSWQQASLRSALSRHAVVSMRNFRAGRIWSVAVASLSHGELGHLVYNLLAFLSVAPDLHEELGRARFLWLWLAGAVGAAVGTVLWQRVVRGLYEFESLGASGAIYGLLAFTARLAPSRRFLLAGASLTSAQFLVAHVLLDLVMRRQHAAIDVAAHVGGAMAGLYYFEWLRG